MGAKFRLLSQKNGRCDAAPKGRCTTPTHIYSICIGLRLIRPKPQDKFRREHWKKTLGLVKCCGDLSSDTSHRQTDRPTSPPRGGVQLQPIYIFNLYRFQIDPTKTLGGVQDRTLEKITWICQMLWGPKFRRLSQTNGRIDVALKGRCKTPAHIYSICIGFKLIRLKP